VIAIGVLMVVAGLGASGWAIVAATTRRRPVDLVAALAAPIGFLVAVTGGMLIAVPDFLR
jgi:hypothetical protein